MTGELYTIDILRLASEVSLSPRLPTPDASAECRSRVCGSRIFADVSVDREGRISHYGHEVKACAMGQASATILARHVAGRNADELEAARRALADYLAGTSNLLPDWPDIAVLERARSYPARHAAILLPFEAVVAAMKQARTFVEMP